MIKIISTTITTTMLCLMLALGQTAQADIEVNFIEGAPKDKFVFKNTGQCILNDLSLKVDLSNSSGRLIFDTTGTGSGVEVFQPFEVVKGDIELISSVEGLDGSNELILNISKLSPNKEAGFTIDLDDTLVDSLLGNIRVAGAEIKGGLINLTISNDETVSATFGGNSKALLSMPSC